MEFWNDMATDKSWEILIKIKKEIDFILIGGWACYLHTKRLKSKDIDIIVGFKALGEIKEKYKTKKTDFLKKYEAKIEGISLDVYVPHYSDFVLPVKEIEKNTMSLEGFEVPRPEVLLILKQEAEFDRKDSVKGQKDRVDIINLAMSSDFDWENYKKLIGKYGLERYRKRLKKIIRGARKEFEYLGIKNLRKQKLRRKKLLGKIR